MAKIIKAILWIIAGMAAVAGITWFGFRIVDKVTDKYLDTENGGDELEG